MSSRFDPRLGERVLEEHEQIHFYLDQLARAMKDLSPESADVEPLRRLSAQIGSLRERVEEHFQQEESALFPSIVETLPGAQFEVRSLAAQHARILGLLEAARARARRFDPSEIASVRDELDGFLQSMRKHEREEEALLQRAVQNVNLV